MRSYIASVDIGALAAAKTLILLELPATCAIRIDSVLIGNADNDANEQLKASLARVTDKGAPVGTAITPAKKDEGDPASVVTVLGNLTVEPNTYGEVLNVQGFSNLAGYIFEPVLGAPAHVRPLALLGLRLLNAPAAGTNITASIEYTEIG